MPTVLDSRLRPRAAALIAKYGRAMTLRRMTVGDYVPATGAAAEYPQDYLVTGVISAPSSMMLAQGLAQSGDRIVLLAAEAVQIQPVAGDVLLMDDANWQILTVRSMFSGELVATYECLTRT